MNVTDPIADLLTRIRNAIRAGHTQVSVGSSRIKADILRILKKEGFILDFASEDGTSGRKTLHIYLKYAIDRTPAITAIDRVSRPGLRRYTPADKIPRVLGGMGLAILSTSQGVMSDREARKRKTGGEVLCNVW